MYETLKVKLDKSSHLKEYLEDLLRWESEGGNSSDLNDILDDLDSPLRAGDVFEVQEGHIISEKEEFYLEVKIKKVESIDRID
ncbi:hypothetical protein G3570_08070 [Balneolaceae bacterium YR4-1]|uniref:Uncharacterized protein n=1 Tax=Halalkalibaculum roseum TaxID=2709311 RepID=A0A6M1T3N3_9BACT|nr:hypothetical protein [Halalkalibaculum roseum]NGP76585.1 hypothetical protein [Halalkalibaculum roseum]